MSSETPGRPDDTRPLFDFREPAAAPPPPRRRGRTAFVASVLTASMLLGGAAGVGGAAAWTAFDDDAPAEQSSGSDGLTARVVDTPDEPAAEGSVEQVAREVLPSVVRIDVRGAEGAGSGSGIILSADGRILTNNHVVEGAGSGSGSIFVHFDDGTTAPARVLGNDPLTDTAVLQAEDVEGLTPATIGSSADLAVGEAVVAIGSPFGLDATVTSGIVSALDRPVDVGSDAEGNTTAYPAVQTDAAINPGNSGGPLVDLAGRVVGINSSIRTASSAPGEAGSIGLGFAIPIDEVLPIVDQMIAGETPTHARLGISVSDVAVDGADEAPVQGARIREVGEGSTAGDAGLAAGDVITRVDDTVITGADSLVATVRSYRPGDRVTVTYLRDGDTATTELTLDSDADTSGS